MAKHCTNCGHELRDGDKFCSECGTLVGGTASPARPIRYEYCEIECEWVKDGGIFGKDEYQLRAKAVGPKGVYYAMVDRAQTNSFMSEDDYTTAAVNSMIQRLAADGWEVIPGKERTPLGNIIWYTFKFRRPIRG